MREPSQPCNASVAEPKPSRSLCRGSRRAGWAGPGRMFRQRRRRVPPSACLRATRLGRWLRQRPSGGRCLSSFSVRPPRTRWRRDPTWDGGCIGAVPDRPAVSRQLGCQREQFRGESFDLPSRDLNALRPSPASYCARRAVVCGRFRAPSRCMARPRGSSGCRSPDTSVVRRLCLIEGHLDPQTCRSKKTSAPGCVSPGGAAVVRRAAAGGRISFVSGSGCCPT